MTDAKEKFMLELVRKTLVLAIGIVQNSDQRTLVWLVANPTLCSRACRMILTQGLRDAVADEAPRKSVVEELITDLIKLAKQD